MWQPPRASAPASASTAVSQGLWWLTAGERGRGAAGAGTFTSAMPTAGQEIWPLLVPPTGTVQDRGSCLRSQRLSTALAKQLQS